MGISLWGHKVSLLGSLLCFRFCFPVLFSLPVAEIPPPGGRPM